MLQSQKNLRGIVAMTVAMLFFVGNDACMKIARQTLETGQALIVRGFIAVGLLAVAVAVTRSWRKLPMVANPMAMLRAGVEGMVAALYIGALSAMALADITAMLMLTPLMLTAISTIVFGEKVGWRRWSAVVVGFIGILMVIRPGGQSAPLWAVAMAFGSVVLVAFRDVLTRRLPMAIPSLILTLTTTFGTMSAGAVLLVWGQPWLPMETPALIAISFAAVFVLIGNYAIIEAFRDSEISAVAPFRYSVILWAVVLGYILFGEVPQALSVAGLSLVVASGLYTVHRERVRRREEAAAIGGG